MPAPWYSFQNRHPRHHDHKTHLSRPARRWCIFWGSTQSLSVQVNRQIYTHTSTLLLFSCSVTFSSLDPMDCSMPGLPVHHQLSQLAQTHVHWADDAIQPSHPLSSPFPLAFNVSQHQGPFYWVCSLHQVTKVLELQLQHQSLQIFSTDFL